MKLDATTCEPCGRPTRVLIEGRCRRCSRREEQVTDRIAKYLRPEPPAAASPIFDIEAAS